MTYIEHLSLRNILNKNQNGICYSVDYLLSLAKRSPVARVFRGDIGYQVVTLYYEACKMYTHAQAVRAIIASIRNSFVSQLRKGLAKKGLVKTFVHNLIGNLII